MANSQKINKAFVDGLQPQAKDAIFYDSELKGFAVKVTPAARKVFIVLHRPKNHTGNRKLFTIGPYGKFTVQQAREQALEVLNASRNGVDLHEVKKEEARKKEQNIISELAEQFLEKHASQNKTGKETKRIFKYDVLPAIGSRSIHTLKKHDIISIIEDIENRGAKVMANRTLAHVKTFMNWCVSRGIIDHSPAEGIKPPTKELSRNRVLSEEEIKQAILAARQRPYPFGPYFQLLFLTGQRREEVAAMRWTEIDLKKKIWTLSGTRTKNRKAHDVHLCDAAIAILKTIQHFTLPDGTESDLVFTTTGKTPISGFSKGKAKLDKQYEIPHWRQHDVRRTVATEMSKLSVPPHVVEAILNHKSGTVSGVAAVYQRNQFDAERKEAMDKWCQKLASIMGDEAVPASPA